MSKASNIISRIISTIFQPLLIPFYSLLLLSLYTDLFSLYRYGIRSFLLPVLILTFIIPAMFILILRATGYIKDISLSRSKDRILPYLIFILSNISLVYIFSKINVPLWFIGFLSMSIFIALYGFVMNFFFKISTQMLALGAAIGTVIFISFVLEGINPYLLLIILFLLSGCIAVCDIYLGYSTPTQVYIGFISGLIFSYLYFNTFILLVAKYLVKH